MNRVESKLKCNMNKSYIQKATFSLEIESELSKEISLFYLLIEWICPLLFKLY